MTALSYQWDHLNPRTYNNRSGHYKFRRELGFILQHGKGHWGSILDIAGGSGRFAVPLLDYSDDITVSDISPAALQLLEHRAPEIATVPGNFTDCSFQRKFSLVLCIEGLGYFPDWKAFFRKVHGLLEDDGRFVFTCTNPRSWRFWLRMMRRRKTSYNDLPLKQLRQVLQKSGFTIESIEGMNWIPLPLTSNSRLVQAFAFMERTLRLKRWHRQSPWLLLSVRKKKD